MMPLWNVPWNVMLPSVSGLCVIVAVVSWLVGRASLRRSIDREALESADNARLRAANESLSLENQRLRDECRSHRAALRGVISLATQEVG
jgi:hypothetical protein